jgi:hypothetical protein
VVAGQAADPNATFTAQVENLNGTAGNATLTFSQNSPRTHTFGGHDGTLPGLDDFRITETGLPRGYQLAGFWVGTGNVACPVAGSRLWRTDNQLSADIPDLGFTEKTVCFLNVKIDPRTCPDLGLTLVDKFNWQTGSYVWESDPGGRQVTIGTGSTATSGTWTSSVPIGAVIVKAATDFKVIPNPPPYPPNTVSGSFNNDGMVGPGGPTPDISNVQFCAGTLEPKGHVIVGKVKDPTPGVPAADGSQFSGIIVNQASADPPGGTTYNWGPIGFGGFTSPIQVLAGMYTLDETGTQGGWTPLGWAAGSITNNQPTCPTARTAYTLANPFPNVDVAENATVVMCVMNTKQAQPTITKVAGPNITGNQTTDPNAVTWTVTVTNPNTARTVWIRDANVTLVGSPAATGGIVGCTGIFASELVDSDGVMCVMPAGTTLTFTVKPFPTPVRTCENRTFNNTAELRVGSSTATPITATGPTLTLLGNEALCALPEISKSADVRRAWTSDPNAVTWTVLVTNPSTDAGGIQRDVWIRDANVTVAAGPYFTGGATCSYGFADQLVDADGAHCVMPAGTTLAFSVRPDPAPERTCRDRQFNNTAELRVGAADATPIPATGPTLTLLGNPALCAPPSITKVAGPNITGNQTSDPNAIAWVVTVTNPVRVDNGIPRTVWIRDENVTVTAGPTYDDASCTGDFAAQLVGDAPGVRCTMETGSSITFTVKPTPTPVRTCEPQPFNNTAELRVGTSTATPITATSPTLTLLGDEALCTKTITIQKAFWGVSAITPADYPKFTISDGVDFAAACGDPVVTRPVLWVPATATWTCTVPYDWSGSVTETPAPGWEKCQGLILAQTAGEVRTFRFNNCKQGQIIVKKVVTNVENDTTHFNVTLSGITPAPTGQIAEWNGGAPVNATFANLPLAPSYTVTEAPQNGYQVLGWAFASPGGVCPAQPTSSAGDASAEVGTLSPGRIVTVCFYNERFGNVVVDKRAPTEAVVPGTTFNWVISVDVEDGPTSGVLTLTDTLPAGFTYGAPTATSPLSCTLTAGVLSCTLPANTGIGTYTVTIPATVPTDTFAICGPHTNSVVFSGANIQGTDSATVTVGCVAADGRILVRKVVRGLPTDTTSFTANVTGPGLTVPAITTFTQQTPGIFPGLVAGTFTVSETRNPAYTYAGFAVGTIIGETVQCPANPTSTAANGSVTLSPISPQAAICFYNDPKVTIRVHKVLDSVGFRSDGEGWVFTLNGCGIGPTSGTTNAQGIVTFANLPPAIGCSYTVTETTQAGWVPQFISQTTQPTQPGQVVTLTFLNIRTFDPPCVLPDDPRCPPPPSSTPTPTPPVATPTPTPTATPTPPTPPVATPTPTPPTPTPTPTPVEEVGGVVTPGPGATPTPIAPAAGSGFGQGEGGMSLLLVLAGLISLSLGLGFFALGRRTSR